MTVQAHLSADERAIVVSIPMRVQRRGGRKHILRPAGTEQPERTGARPDDVLVHALARAHRWKRMLESGRFPSIRALAEAEKVNESYLCRMLRLMLLAPDIIEMILDERQVSAFVLLDLLQPLPAAWAAQRRHFGLS